MNPSSPSNRRLRDPLLPAASLDEPWPQPPPGLEVAIVNLDGDEFAILHFPVTSQTDLTGLSDAESEIANAIVKGMSNEEIARMRRTSNRTVAKQVASIFKKLGVGSRRELVARVRSGGQVR
jgi:DNA-binding NarL/FixJ family response regulator